MYGNSGLQTQPFKRLILWLCLQCILEAIIQLTQISSFNKKKLLTHSLTHSHVQQQGIDMDSFVYLYWILDTILIGYYLGGHQVLDSKNLICLVENGQNNCDNNEWQVYSLHQHNCNYGNHNTHITVSMVVITFTQLYLWQS